MCDVVYTKAKGHGGTVNRTSVMLKQPSEGSPKKDVIKHFAEFKRKHLSESRFCCFLVNFAKFARAPFLQNSTGRLLLIIAVSIVVKGLLVTETVNSDIKTKAFVLI